MITKSSFWLSFLRTIEQISINLLLSEAFLKDADNVVGFTHCVEMHCRDSM